MRMLRVALLAGVAGISSSPVVGTTALKFGPAPAWVHHHDLPAAKASDAPVQLLLEDDQIALEPGKVTTYSDGALKIQNAQGLGAGNLALVWQPETDTVTVNKLQIIRGGKVIDVLAGGQTFTVLRRETNLDAATLDGTLTATIQPEGLQEGDILELATTTEHSDPVLKGHVESMFANWDGLPVDLAHASVQWPTSLRLNVRQTPNLPAAQKSTAKGVNTLVLSGTDVQPLVPPKGAPERFTIGRLAEVTDYASWSDVADLMMPLFRTASAIPASGPLHDEVEKIRVSTTDPLSRATQALALVQDRVRYVALLMGQGGYVPASAEQTWARRFGDCKAKTALLTGILHSLGIQAEPVLAQTRMGDMVADRLPMVALFNHVLVRAHIGGKDYWLDGTRTGDTDLNAIQIPDFGWGLPVVEHAQLVHMVPKPLDLPRLEHKVSIDASAGIYSPAPITIEEIYRGDRAVELNTAYSAASAAQRDEAMHGTAKGYFDGFTIASSGTRFDKAKREFDLTIKGTAKLNWKDRWFFVPTSSIGYDPDFDRPAGPLHDVPFGVNYPTFVKDRATVRLPAGFAAQQKLSAPVHETLAGVEYARTETVSGDTLTVDSSERSVAPEVAYKDAVSAESRLRSLAKDDVYLSGSVGYEASKTDLAALGDATPGSADEYVDRGNLYLNSSSYDSAIADYTAALKLDPKNQWALVDRGLAHVWKGELGDAQKDLDAADAIDRDNAVALRARGLMAQMKGDCAASVDFYTRSLAKDSGNNFAIGHRAVCEAALSKYPDALADSAQALKADPSWLQLRIMRADIFVKQDKRPAAVSEAKLGIGENPGSDSALVVAAGIYNRLGMTTEAMSAYDRALAIKPAAYIYLSRAGSRPASDKAGRMADLDQALKLEPDNEGALSNKAFALAHDGDYAGALVYYDRAAKSDHSVELGANRAVALYKAGRTADARTAFDAARAQARTAVELNDLCWIKATGGVQLDSALQDCRDALKMSPGTGPFLDSLGMVLLKLGKLDDALQAYNQAIAKGAGADSLMGRAFVYRRKGDRAHAEADAAEARKTAAKIDDIFALYGLTMDKPVPMASAAAKTATAH